MSLILDTGLTAEQLAQAEAADRAERRADALEADMLRTRERVPFLLVQPAPAEAYYDVQPEADWPPATPLWFVIAMLMIAIAAIASVLWPYWVTP